MELDIEGLRRETEETLSRNKYILLGIVVLCLIGLVLFMVFAPEFTEAEKLVLFKIPRTPANFSALIQVIKGYTVTSYYYVLSAFCFFYLCLQSFGIPGPLVLSIISGALFGRATALALVTVCSTVGSIVCYFLSESLGKGLVVRKFPTMILRINRQLEPHRHNLFFYLLFLRLMPVIPNWIINLTAPILGIPLKELSLATLIGLIPANFLYINSGMMLSTVQEMGLDYESLLFLIVLGVLALVPTFIVKKKNKPQD